MDNVEIKRNFLCKPGLKTICTIHNQSDYDICDDSLSVKNGNSVWVGINLIILPEVKFGKNCTITARTIATNFLIVGGCCHRKTLPGLSKQNLCVVK